MVPTTADGLKWGSQTWLLTRSAWETLEENCRVLGPISGNSVARL